MSTTSGSDSAKCYSFIRLASPWIVARGGFWCSPVLCRGCGNEIKPFPSTKHLTRWTTRAKRTSHIPPPPLLSAHWLSQIISVLDDRINRIILSQRLLSQNCMAILLVDRNIVSISKQEIIFCLLCGAENSTGKFLISMKGTLELTERKSNSFLLSFSISCLAQKNYPNWQSHNLLSLI